MPCASVTNTVQISNSGIKRNKHIVFKKKKKMYASASTSLVDERALPMKI